MSLLKPNLLVSKLIVNCNSAFKNIYIYVHMVKKHSLSDGSTC